MTGYFTDKLLVLTVFDSKHFIDTLNILEVENPDFEFWPSVQELFACILYALWNSLETDKNVATPFRTLGNFAKERLTEL